MVEHSRRIFLKRASIGAAVVGAATITPTVLAGPADADPIPSGRAHDGPFVAWVKDAKAGEISVLVGEHEVVHTDRKLATRLARIAAQAQQS